MGSQSAQAQGLVLFLIGFVLLAAGFATGGSVLFFIAAVLALGLSVWRFRTCRAPEGNGKGAD